MERHRSIFVSTTLKIVITTSIISLAILVSMALQITAVFESISASNETLARSHAERIGTMVRELADYVGSLRAAAALRASSPEERKAALKALYDRSPRDINEIFVARDGRAADGNGRVYGFVPADYLTEDSEIGNGLFITRAYVPEGRTYPVVSILAPIDREETGLGYVGAEIKTEALSRICNGIGFGETGLVFLAEGSGIVLASPNGADVLAFNLARADEERRFEGLSDIASTANASGERKVPGRYSDGEGIPRVAFTARVPETPGWVLYMTVRAAEYYRMRTRIIAILLATLTATPVVMTILSALLSGNITRPILETNSAFSKLALGDADLTARLRIARKDEMGQLSRSFNSFLDTLHSIIVKLRGEQATLTEATRTLERSSEAVSALNEALTHRVMGITERTGEQNAIMADANRFTALVSDEIEGLGMRSADQAASAGEASAAVEQMVRSIDSIAQTMDGIARSAVTLGQKTVEGTESLARMNRRIGDIVNRSRALGEITSTLARISSMTNLLAMNAAIEAAHAGDHGAGFSVVAGEVRSLAEESALKTKRISQELSLFAAEIEEIEVASRFTETAFASISDTVGETGKRISAIHGALAEQREGSREILAALRILNETSEAVRRGAALIGERNEEMKASMVRLENSIGQIAGGAGDLMEEARRAESQTNALVNIAGMNAAAVERVEGLIGRFKV